ncbi:MAG: hypothetical protein V2I97_11610 [Desulfococcaceae bacterium]|jgi:hypothetical protein|nr:hypothetical protein [Desulfococcaceae bacterium]
MNEKYPHIILTGPDEVSPYTANPRRAKTALPERNRQTHGEYIQNCMQRAWQESENEFAAIHTERNGVYLEFASFPGEDSLTLIAETEIQPYEKNGSNYRSKDMHLYRLPWPTEVLQELGETEAEMRITLSYFAEPGPGEIGWKDRYRYASHGLRFDLNSPVETEDEFVRRINKAAWDEERGKPDTASAAGHWMIGQARSRGSVHSDIWRGTASQLASSNLIAVFPVIGWWRERHHLKKYNNSARYSLIISITTPEQDVDIYTPVAIQLGQTITVPVGAVQ